MKTLVSILLCACIYPTGSSPSLLAQAALGSSGGDSVTRQNLGNAIGAGSLEPQYFGNSVLVNAQEALDQVDYNTDGDMLDQVPQLHQLDRGTVRNLNLAGSAYADVDNGNLLVLLVSEQDEAATDFNSDGDSNDVVLFVHDIANDVTTNVGLAVGNGLAYASQDKVLFGLLEQASQTGDLNGDGDLLDSVLQLYDPGTGQVHNSGLAINQIQSLFSPQFTAKAVDWVLFGVRELDQGGLDLDGDGSNQSDRVIHAISLCDGSTVNLGINAFALYGGTNGVDALIHDQRNGRMHTFDGLTALCRNLGIPKVLDSTHYAFPAGRSFVYLDPETNSDLNGDGDIDPGDWVLHVVSSTTGTLNVLAFACDDLAVDLPFVAFRVNEMQQDADLNGDGDQADSVLHILDLADLSVVNVGLATDKLGQEIYTGGTFPFVKYLRDGLVATSAQEFELGGDQNGDGDILDQIALAVDCATGQVLNSALALVSGPNDFDLDAGVVWFSMNEAAQGQDGNQDGDLLDEIPVAWHPCAGLPSAGPPSPSGAAGTLAGSSLPLGHAEGLSTLLLIDETTGTGDLNGDGDANDVVLQLAQLQTRAELPAPLGLGTTGFHGRIPHLSATGCSFLGGSLQYLLEEGLGGMPAVFVFGTTPQTLPALGGVLYVFPFDFVVSSSLGGTTGTPAAGFVLFDSGPLDASLVGLTIYAQAGVTDPGAVGGVALSNAVVTTVSP